MPTPPGAPAYYMGVHMQPQAKPQPATATAQPTAPATLPTLQQPGAALPATTLAQVVGTTPARSRVNRQTGTRINLWGPVPGATSTWVVQCVAHTPAAGKVVVQPGANGANGDPKQAVPTPQGWQYATAHHTTRKAAKPTVYQPATWCHGCAALVQAAQQAAAAPAQPLPTA